MNSIILLIETIYCNIFRCNNLRRKKLFVFVFSILAISIQFEDFRKKYDPIADELLNARLRKKWLDKCLKSPVSENPSASIMGNKPNHCWNLNEGIFTIFIGHYEAY